MTSFPLKAFRRLRLRRLLVPLLAAALGAALGVTGVIAADPFGGHGAPSLPALTGHGSPHTALNAQHVYDRLIPSVLDINAVLRYDDETAEGTGFVFGAPGDFVLTNNHVIKDATSVTATLAATGKTYQARIVGTDPDADIAVLQLTAAPRLPAAPVGDSGDVELGDQVLVIGNQAGQGGPPTIAPGIINSLNRTIEATDGGAAYTETLHDMLQTSAQIEPGDSGGPLADAEGQVIGVNTAASTGAGAAGFAIPVDSALAAARRIAAGRPGPGIELGTGSFLGVLVAAGAAVSPQAQPQPSLTDHGASRRPAVSPAVADARGKGPGGPGRTIAAPWRSGSAPANRGVPGRGAGPFARDGGACLGTESEAAMPARVAPIRSGALVEGVLCGTPAAASGLAAGDDIVAAAGRAVATPDALADIVAGCAPGTELPVTWVDLGGVTRTALIRVAAAPAP